MWESPDAGFFWPWGHRAGLSVKGPKTPTVTWVGSPPLHPPRREYSPCGVASGTPLGTGWTGPATLVGGGVLCRGPSSTAGWPCGPQKGSLAFQASVSLRLEGLNQTGLGFPTRTPGQRASNPRPLPGVGVGGGPHHCRSPAGLRDNAWCSQPISLVLLPSACRSCAGWGRERSHSLTEGTELISRGAPSAWGCKGQVLKKSPHPALEPARPLPLMASCPWHRLSHGGHPLVSSHLSFGPCPRPHPSPSARPLQTEIQKPDTLPSSPKLLWEPREEGSRESPHGHRPVTS